MTTAALFVLLFVFMALGMPIAIAHGLSSLVTIMAFGHESLASQALKLYETSAQFTLLAIPFFILSGAFMTTGGVARRMIRFANACIGHLRAGLALASVLACMLFAAVSGSSPATVVAVGSIVIAGMVRAGYSKEFAAGVICNAGTLGILIPPSIVMVVYAAATSTSVGKLFIAGIIPGIVLGLMLMAAIYVRARMLDLPREPRATLREALVAGRESLWGLLLLVIILGGIFGGVFTPTEAAAVAAIYAFVIAVFVYRDIGMKHVPKVLVDAARVTVMLMFIIANALLFAHVLTTERIPQAIAEQIVAWGMAPWQFLIVVNVLLLIAGNFMEPTGIILILAPILFPIATELGIDPVHLGVIMTVNMEIGMVTPPVGLNLFVTSGITGMSVMETVRAALPWLSVLLVFL
ncbi:MAG TPA: TRAP transporter large permease, partial [Casimicrobiaceae bacterium]